MINTIRTLGQSCGNAHAVNDQIAYRAAGVNSPYSTSTDEIKFLILSMHTRFSPCSEAGILRFVAPTGGVDLGRSLLQIFGPGVDVLVTASRLFLGLPAGILGLYRHVIPADTQFLHAPFAAIQRTLR